MGSNQAEKIVTESLQMKHVGFEQLSSLSIAAAL
jgi:hypothetical protein